MNKKVKVFVIVLFLCSSLSLSLAYGNIFDDVKKNFKEQTSNFIEQGKQKFQESVEKINKNVQNATEQGKKKIQDSVGETKTNVQKKIEEGKQYGSEVIEESKQQFQEDLEDFNSTVQDVTKKGQQYGSEVIEEGKKQYGDDIQKYSEKTQEFIKKMPKDPESVRIFASDEWDKRTDKIWDYTATSMAKEMGMDENDPMIEPTSHLVRSLSNPFKSDEELSEDLNEFFTDYLEVITREDEEDSNSPYSSSNPRYSSSDYSNQGTSNNTSSTNYSTRNRTQMIPRAREIKIVSLNLPLFIPATQSQRGQLFVWNGSVPLFFPGTQLGFVLRINVYSNVKLNGMTEIALQEASLKKMNEYIQSIGAILST